MVDETLAGARAGPKAAVEGSALLWGCVIGLVLIALLATGSVITTAALNAEKQRIVVEINVSGRQRMLSQRIGVLATQLALSGPDGLPAISETLLGCVDLMRRAHIALLSRELERIQDTRREGVECRRGVIWGSAAQDELSPRVWKAVYDGDPSLQGSMDVFLDSATTIGVAAAAGSVDQEAALNLVALSQGILPRRLDVLTLAFQQEGEELVRRLTIVVWMMWGATILLLIVEFLFIFRPLSRRIGTALDSNAKTIAALREQEEELTEARDRAETANHAKSRFVASMNHELRTPLNAILGFAQILQMTGQPLTSDQALAVDRIMGGGRHLLELVDEILLLSQMDSGNLRCSIEHVAAESVIYECEEMGRILVGKNKMRFECAAAVEGIVVSADRVRMKQALLNLLSNAAKYGKPGGLVRLSAELTADGAFLRVTVEDDGRGIPRHKQVDLFEPFNRLGAESSSVEGTGIGLTLTRSLMELMGGAIGFWSAENEGSRFWLDFPVAGDESPQEEEATADGLRLIGVGAAPSAKFRVLYVEDNPSNRELIDQAFRSVGLYQLDLAVTGEEGLQKAQAQPPDLILLDINLPGMDGFAVLEAIQADPDLRDLPVIAMSADSMPETRDRAEAAGFYAYLTKPIDLDKTFTTVRLALEKGGARLV